MKLELVLTVLIFINALVTLCVSANNIGWTSIFRLTLYSLTILFEVVLIIGNLINGGPWFYNLLLVILQVDQMVEVNEMFKLYKIDKKSKRSKYKSDNNSEIIV